MSELFDEAYFKSAEEFKKQWPDTSTAYKEWHAKVFKASGLDEKTAELVALSAAIALKCEYCIETHKQKAVAKGATPQELAGVVHVAAAVSAGAGVNYGLRVFREKKEA